jgi:pyruvate,orthophosphate dikinase
VDAGEARELRGAYVLAPAARERLEELLAEERAGLDHDEVQALYDEFTVVNADFKTLAHDWQASHQQSVLDRLPDIHARVTPVVDRLGERVPRLAPYSTRLQTALARVEAGDSDWLLKPLIDSYHTVWFELHEELISVCGLTRLDEAAAGRAH